MSSDKGGFTVEGAQKELDEFKKSIEHVVPNPINYRVIDPKKDYSTDEIKKLLQEFGSYLSYLHAFIGRLSGEYTIVNKGLKNGLAVAILDPELANLKTLAEREAHILANSPDFAHYKKMEIVAEAEIEMLKGWAKGFETAYAAVSRMLSASEADSLTLGHLPG